MKRAGTAHPRRKLVLLKPPPHTRPRHLPDPPADRFFRHRKRSMLAHLVRFQPLDPFNCAHGSAKESVGLAINMSPGGMCLLLGEPPVLHQVAKVSVPTASPEVEVRTLAEVRWKRHLRSDPVDLYSVGVKFLL